MKKYFPYLLIIVLAIILFFVKRAQRDDLPQRKPSTPTTTKPRNKKDPEVFDNKERGLDRNQNIILTKHAKCRMRCRHITLEEVKEIVEDGKINYSKSQIDATPEYALEGYSHESQHIRIVVAPKDDGLVLVTCIDLDEDWKCECG